MRPVTTSEVKVSHEKVFKKQHYKQVVVVTTLVSIAAYQFVCVCLLSCRLYSHRHLSHATLIPRCSRIAPSYREVVGGRSLSALVVHDERSEVERQRIKVSTEKEIMRIMWAKRKASAWDAAPSCRWPALSASEMLH